jgi:hypothetical protein
MASSRASIRAIAAPTGHVLCRQPERSRNYQQTFIDTYAKVACAKLIPERHEYELYLAIEDIDHSRTKTMSPQTNGICEGFHKTVLNEFYRVAFCKKVYRSIDELQVDLDAWFRDYNEARPHQGRWCYGKTPTQTFLDAMPLTKEKMIAA